MFFLHVFFSFPFFFSVAIFFFFVISFLFFKILIIIFFFFFFKSSSCCLYWSFLCSCINDNIISCSRKYCSCFNTSCLYTLSHNFVLLCFWNQNVKRIFKSFWRWSWRRITSSFSFLFLFYQFPMLNFFFSRFFFFLKKRKLKKN